MAGAGYKLFATGDVLTATQVNTYLMQQTIMVFANSAARTSALSGVLAEGMFSYLQDTNSTEYYDGSAWQSISNPGDITAVTAGTGISGGGTSGAVTITNSMATTIDAKGDLIVGTGADTFARLPVGTNTYTLVADSSTATGLAWSAPAGGGKVLQVVMGTYALETAAGGATWVDTGLTATITPSSASSKVLVMGIQTGVAKTANDTRVGLRIVRDSTEINKFCQQALYGATDSVPYGSEGFAYLDSPSTTSATIYKTQQNNSGSNGQSRTQWQDVTTSTILLLEIGA